MWAGVPICHAADNRLYTRRRTGPSYAWQKPSGAFEAPLITACCRTGEMEVQMHMEQGIERDAGWTCTINRPLTERLLC